MMKNKPHRYEKGHKNLYLVTGEKHVRFKHGFGNANKRTPIYNIWGAIKRRCLKKNDKSYKYYGGKGITVCDKWMDFIGFYEDMGASYEKGLSIDRIDNSKGYCKENCRWSTWEVQSKNKTNVKLYEHKGKMISIPEIARMYQINYLTLWTRLKNCDYDMSKALSKPLRGRNLLESGLTDISGITKSHE